MDPPKKFELQNLPALLQVAQPVFEFASAPPPPPGSFIAQNLPALL